MFELYSFMKIQISITLLQQLSFCYIYFNNMNVDLNGTGGLKNFLIDLCRRRC
jgi:hypothetical protein